MIKYPDIFLFLASVGTLDERDIKFMLKNRPKLITILERYDDLKLKYREDIIVKTIINLLKGYKKEEIADKIKVLNLMLTTLPSQMTKLFVPHIAEVIGSIELELKDKGLLDHRMERILDSLYDALNKDQPKISEILTQISRLHAFVKKKEVPLPQPSDMQSKTKTASGRNVDMLVKLVTMVYEAQRANSPLPMNEAIRKLYEQYSDVMGSPAQAYMVIKTAMSDGYIKNIKGVLYVTKKGEELLK